MEQKVDVLIVDDRIDGLITLEAVLDMPEVNLVKAQSGREALELLDFYEFGVILLDVQMPELDGFQTAQLIRKHSKNQITPIIFVTAINKDDQYIYRGYDVGAVDYVFKPFEPQILRAKVSIFIELFLKSRKLQEQAEIIRENERRERYLRLAELEVENLRRYRNLGDAIPHIVWRARSDGTLDYFNKGWSTYTGLSLEASVGCGWQSAMHLEDLKALLKIWMMSMAEGKSFETECRILNEEGDARWFLVKSIAERNQTGQVVAWIGTATDIHDRKIMEMKLIQAEKDANAANLSKTSFLANMSHEIRTPMNAILGFTELILDPDQTAEERVNCIRTVQRNAGQLLKIIDEILDISKVESGRLQIENIDVNVGGLLDDVRSLLRLQALDKGLEFKIDLDTSIPRLISSDPTRLRQILLNLIGNSIKFTSEGHVHVNVSWIQKPTPDLPSKMRFKISDTGVGIDPARAARLFQPFVQEDSATTRNYGGTGLGLALSRQLARAMGGDVTLEYSEIGQGSRFIVEVNAEAIKGTAFLTSLDVDFDTGKTAQVIPRKGDKRLQGMKILLVEDVEDNQALIGYFLSRAGANFDIASNGAEGIEKALSESYDAVLMDIQMPVLDGYEAIKRLRAQGYEIPIIALTAHALHEERDKSFEAGSTGHLTKPVEYNVLVETLAGISTGREKRDGPPL